MGIDYGKEVENLDKTNTWKPEVGVHKFVILSEPEETEYVENVNGVEKRSPQLKIEIEVEGEQKTWFIGKGKTSESAYGQLMILGKYYKQLAGRDYELIVKQGKDRKNYTFPEASKIQQLEASKKEE